ncbi:MAG TPA: ROK family protein [Prolixibacteraceae bacterium]|nr:ROK family protein [Prolixibacteraceae bacterium]
MSKYAIGVDVGGSHLSCAAVDLDTQVMIEGSFSTVPIDNNASSDAILSGWSEAILETIEKMKGETLAGIGFGMPGPFEYHTGIARFAQVEKYYSLNGVDVASGLRVKLGLPSSVPLRFMNDASAFAAGEAWIGSASHALRSVSITLGTGFGSAFVCDGVPVVDGDEVPQLGCVWHLPYREGIADDYFSTRWFVKRYFEKTGMEVGGVKSIADAAHKSEIANSLFIEYGNNMGEFFAPWLKRFGAGVLVIGGNIAGAYHLFGPSFEEALKHSGIDTVIKLSALKENAAVIGSARMIDPVYWEKIKPILPRM